MSIGAILKRQIPVLVLTLSYIIGTNFYNGPNEIDPVYLDVAPLQELSGVLAPNEHLSTAKSFYEGEFGGPDSIAHYKDFIYTGTHDGQILRVNSNHGRKVELYARLNKTECQSIVNCGRPLGIRVDPFQPRLIVADAYLGLYAVSLVEEEKERVTKLFPTEDYLPAINVTLFNDVDVVADGVFVVSESSTQLPWHKFTSLYLQAAADGRLILVDTNRKSYKVLAENLAFPSGVLVTGTDKKSVLVAESTRMRITRVSLEEDDETPAQITTLTDRIPGLPDKLRASPRGGFWVGIIASATTHEPSLFYRLRHWPRVRWLMYKLLPSAIIHSMLLSRYILVVRVNEETGQILQSWQHDGAEIDVGFGISEVRELANGQVFLGSHYLPFLRHFRI